MMLRCSKIKKEYDNLKIGTLSTIVYSHGNGCYEVATYHHEKWNGKGYPLGLQKEEIPLHARIMAVFDAVSANRCYRKAMPLDECFKIIENGIGTDFDPTIATTFLNVRKKVETIFRQMEKESSIQNINIIRY